MLRPFFRSRLMWLGLFSFFFLIWAWNDSATKASWISYSGLGLNLRGCSASVGMRYERRGEKLRWARWERQEMPPSAAVVWRNEEDGWFLRLSFPFVMVSYLILWVGLMFWWQRRKSRLLKLHAASSRDHEPGSTNAPDQG